MVPYLERQEEPVSTKELAPKMGLSHYYLKGNIKKALKEGRLSGKFDKLMEQYISPLVVQKEIERGPLHEKESPQRPNGKADVTSD